MNGLTSRTHSQFGQSPYGQFPMNLFESELEGEVNRHSRDYIKWVQQSLNQIMGLRLAADGVAGPQTRSAIRSFQTRQGLAADGIVGAKTEVALKAALGKDTIRTPGGTAPSPTSGALPALSAQERAEFERLTAEDKTRFLELRKTIEKYTGVARRDADRGSRTLLQRGVFRVLPRLLGEIINLTNITRLPSGWSLTGAKPLLVGNVLYNLAFPETINQGGWDRLGGKPDPTCFSASTQILLARRFPVTYVRLIIQLATTNKATFAGGDSIGPLTFVSTSLYKSLDAVLLQTAFDTYFNRVMINVTPTQKQYRPGDELKVHRQVFGPKRPPRYAEASDTVAAFRKAFILHGGNVRPWEIINLCTGAASDPNKCGNHSVVLTRIAGGRVYFYNPWANEEERNMMFGSAAVSVSGHGERPAESSMTQADFENQLTTVFHN